MLNLPDEVKKRFANGGHTKNLRLVFESGRPDITNANIIAESLHFRESVSSSDSLTFGTADASILEFETIGVENLLGQWFMAYLEVDASGLDEELQTMRADLPFPVYPVSLGRFVVTACPRNHEAMARRKFTTSGKLNHIEFAIPEPLYSTIKSGDHIAYFNNPVEFGLTVLSNSIAALLTDDPLELVEAGTFDNSHGRSSVTIPSVSFLQPTFHTWSLNCSNGPNPGGTIAMQAPVVYHDLFRTKTNSTEIDTSRPHYIAAMGEPSLVDTDEGVEQVTASLTEALISLGAYYRVTRDSSGMLSNYYLTETECRRLAEEILRINNYFGTVLVSTNTYWQTSTAGISHTNVIAASRGQRPVTTFAVPMYSKSLQSGRSVDNSVVAQKPYELTITSGGTTLWEMNLVPSANKSSITMYNTPEGTLGALPDLFIPTDPASTSGYLYLSTTLPRLKDAIVGLTELRGGFLSTARDGNTLIKTLKAVTDETLTPSQYSECWFDELDAEPVGSIVYQLNDQIYTYEFGEGQSVYHFQNNDLFKNFPNAGPSDIEAMFDEFLVPALQRITYTPYELSVSGHPGLEAGDRVRIELADGNAFESYVMSRDLNGIQQLTDSFTAEGQTLYDLATETEET